MKAFAGTEIFDINMGTLLMIEIHPPSQFPIKGLSPDNFSFSYP